MLDLVNKEKSNFEHKHFEFVELEDLVDEYKIEKFDEYRSLLLRRRNIKDEAINLKNVKEQLNIIIENTDRLHKRTRGFIDKAILSTESAITNTVPEELDKQVVKEIPYNNFKERINLMKQLQPKEDIKMLNNAESGWCEFMSEERSLEDYIEKFNIKLTRENIIGKTKEILLKNYIADIGSRMGYKVI
jgi:hypothetical protein